MISYKPVFLVLGFLLSKLALFMYIPFLMAVVTGTQGALDFGLSAIITHIGGLVCVAIGGKTSLALKVKDAFLITTLVWVLGSAFASLPFVFINEISFTNAFFWFIAAFRGKPLLSLRRSNRCLDSHIPSA
ncbi:hypothetical protein BCT11_13550 [Vibrio sp. 10N.222.52.B12]|uniref:hypothetical protein n=1 Tax=Vibrio sp. 10N.222.52.B12 TaxID=1880840 RepID=UPI000CB78A37|nr:hypothetical protein [Vibrio sp. 10N.222.52.B12]PMO40176.1 hypothetical protein BCT11_13550 [Vibrio sp. 10N.222.52.B12]